MTDDNKSAQVDIEIVEPELLEITASATDETASELGVGTADVTGGTLDYDVVWADADGNVVDFGLAGRVYTVTATDAVVLLQLKLKYYSTQSASSTQSLSICSLTQQQVM